MKKGWIVQLNAAPLALLVPAYDEEDARNKALEHAHRVLGGSSWKVESVRPLTSEGEE